MVRNVIITLLVIILQHGNGYTVMVSIRNGEIIYRYYIGASIQGPSPIYKVNKAGHWDKDPSLIKHYGRDSKEV